MDPGRLLPDDLPRIARKLGVSRDELLKRFLVFHLHRQGNSEIQVPSPLKLKNGVALAEPGTIVDRHYEGRPGRCIFLDQENRCALHPDKPFECRAYLGCRHTFLGRRYNADFVRSYFLARWKKYLALSINQASPDTGQRQDLIPGILREKLTSPIPKTFSGTKKKPK